MVRISGQHLLMSFLLWSPERENTVLSVGSTGGGDSLTSFPRNGWRSLLKTALYEQIPRGLFRSNRYNFTPFDSTPLVDQYSPSN